MTTYSDYNKGIFRHNAVINGNFNVWQRGTSFAGGNQGYTADQWIAGDTMATGNSSFTAEETIKPNDNCKYTFKFTITTAQSSLGSTEYTYLYQPIEGYNCLSLYKRKAVFSFWAYSNHTGTYSVWFRNGAINSSYVKDFTIDSANTWEYKVIPVDLNDTVGVWNFTDTRSLNFGFTLGCGTSYRTSTLGQWISGNYICSNNVPNTFQQTVDNVFILSQIQLEVGEVATDFDHKPMNQELLDCLRYYQAFVVNHHVGTYVQSGGGVIYSDIFINKMRSTPTMTISASQMWHPSIGWANTTGTSVSAAYPDRVRFVFQNTANQNYVVGTAGLIIATVGLFSVL